MDIIFYLMKHFILLNDKTINHNVIKIMLIIQQYRNLNIKMDIVINYQ